ncbi:hypothetical protein NQ315_003465 [Exocentrus adspersus]|uniref:DDE-1 domain-containing protein n=1 Tax=Exocentrus adspersus TaxID=1586481 RepID=A0AAV8V524_9CUCU|nr:hypothetical protein NQ315_003465 [Exocentrus adspersus]
MFQTGTAHITFKVYNKEARFVWKPLAMTMANQNAYVTSHLGSPLSSKQNFGSEFLHLGPPAEGGTNVTLIAAINVIGCSVPPMFVFPRKFFKEHMLKGAPIGSIGIANPSGWSTGDIFLKYLKHFINVVKPTPENKIILIVGNHESHLSIPAINMAREHGVIMLTFPPHTSHRLQPLDRSVFGPFKKYYNQACHEWLLNNPGKPMTIYEVAECVGKSYPRAFTPSNIESGFRVFGIFPLNRHVFQEH